MNTPNKLTILRILLSPVFLFFLLNTKIPHSYLYANLIFIAASVTDLLDGSIARKNNLITDFGKFLDPLADKMLVNAALIGFLANKLCDPWLVFIVLTREFLVISLRLVASGNGKILSAGIWGKIKTVTQLVSIIAMMLFMEIINIYNDFDYLKKIGLVMLWISVVFTIISGVQYFYTNRKYVDHNK